MLLRAASLGISFQTTRHHPGRTGTRRERRADGATWPCCSPAGPEPLSLPPPSGLLTVGDRAAMGPPPTPAVNPLEPSVPSPVLAAVACWVIPSAMTLVRRWLFRLVQRKQRHRDLNPFLCPTSLSCSATASGQAQGYTLQIGGCSHREPHTLTLRFSGGVRLPQRSRSMPVSARPSHLF